jgi:hypothetical protein
MLVSLHQQPFIAPSLPSNAPVLPKRIAKCLYFVGADQWATKEIHTRDE